MYQSRNVSILWYIIKKEIILKERNLQICRDDIQNAPPGFSKKLDVFETETLQNLIVSLKKDFDYVIVDGQSVSGSSDVSIISKYFDGVVFVVECEKTRWEVLQQSKEKIKGVGGKILGVVLNKRVYYITQKVYGKI